MSPALNESSAIQRFEGKDVIEIRNGSISTIYIGTATYIKLVCDVDFTLQNHKDGTYWALGYQKKCL